MILTEIIFAVGIAFGYVPYLAYAVKCCQTSTGRDTLHRSNLQCHNSDDFQFCFLCRKSPCLFLGITFEPTTAIGIKHILKDSLSLLEPTCKQYEKTFGGVLLLEGDICLCNDNDFCNKQYWDDMWRITNSVESYHRNGNETTRPAYSNYMGQNGLIAVFVVSAVSVFGLAFFCILCVQHSCIFSLACCDNDGDKV